MPQIQIIDSSANVPLKGGHDVVLLSKRHVIAASLRKLTNDATSYVAFFLQSPLFVLSHGDDIFFGKF